jgi:hypothetical protein
MYNPSICASPGLCPGPGREKLVASVRPGAAPQHGAALGLPDWGGSVPVLEPSAHGLLPQVGMGLLWGWGRGAQARLTPSSMSTASLAAGLFSAVWARITTGGR